MIYVFVILFYIITFALTISLLFIHRFYKLFNSVEKNLDESIQIIENRYNAIYEILESSVGLLEGDPIAYKFANEINNLKNDIMLISSKLSNPIGILKENKDDF